MTRPAPWWASQSAPPAGWFTTSDGAWLAVADDTGRTPPVTWGTSMSGEARMHGRHVDPEGPATEVMEPVKLERTGPLPVLDLGPVEAPPPGPVRRRRDESSPTSAWLLLLAILAVAVVAFVAGQITARTGAVPPPPMPARAAAVVTAAQMTRLWPLVEPDQRDAMCGPWKAGQWQQAVTDQWAHHLASPRGGSIDVDREAVGEFLDAACARWGGG